MQSLYKFSEMDLKDMYERQAIKNHQRGALYFLNTQLTEEKNNVGLSLYYTTVTLKASAPHEKRLPRKSH